MGNNTTCLIFFEGGAGQNHNPLNPNHDHRFLYFWHKRKSGSFPNIKKWTRIKVKGLKKRKKSRTQGGKQCASVLFFYTMTFLFHLLSSIHDDSTIHKRVAVDFWRVGIFIPSLHTSFSLSTYILINELPLLSVGRSHPRKKYSEGGVSKLKSWYCFFFFGGGSLSPVPPSDIIMNSSVFWSENINIFKCVSCQIAFLQIFLLGINFPLGPFLREKSRGYHCGPPEQWQSAVGSEYVAVWMMGLLLLAQSPPGV